MAIEIVDFPINSMVIFHCYVSSPEGMIGGTIPKWRNSSSWWMSIPSHSMPPLGPAGPQHRKHQVTKLYHRQPERSWLSGVEDCHTKPSKSVLRRQSLFLSVWQDKAPEYELPEPLDTWLEASVHWDMIYGMIWVGLKPQFSRQTAGSYGCSNFPLKRSKKCPLYSRYWSILVRTSTGLAQDCLSVLKPPCNNGQPRLIGAGTGMSRFRRNIPAETETQETQATDEPGFQLPSGKHDGKKREES